MPWAIPKGRTISRIKIPMEAKTPINKFCVEYFFNA
tara:strand:- start:832 stop:939 length:108 start_codon:yes stop_codon:yes gene_type:complete